MKKIISLFIAFLLITSSVFSASLEVDYFENATDLAMQQAYVTNGLTKIIGTDTQGTSNLTAGYSLCQKFQASASGNCDKIEVYCLVNSNVRVGIYTDNAGSPNTLLNQSASTAITSGGWRSITIDSTALTSGTYYWLACICETTGGTSNTFPGNTGVYTYQNMGGYTTLPSTATGTPENNYLIAIRGNTLVLQSYSESTIKTQGSYALKAVAAITDSLNKTLTHTFAVNSDLTGVNKLRIDDYALRTGSNYKIGLHDTGGTTTEYTPNILSSNTWQTDYIDLSAVTDANKDNIDTCTITITNADSANTIILDYFGIFQGGGGGSYTWAN